MQSPSPPLSRLSSARPPRILILGGSSDATALARDLAGRTDLTAVISLAGRTREPAPQPLPTRVGGFGGIDGLAAHLRAEAIDLLVDATHPFATRITHNARVAAETARVPLIHVERPGWRAGPGDRWLEVADIEAAVDALGEVPRRVFLTIGRLRLGAFARAPRHHYLVRTIDPAAQAYGLPNVAFIEARPPFDAAAEASLMRAHRIAVLVTKNSGGVAAYGKLAAARDLGLSVILLRRPAESGGTVDVAGALAAIEAHVSAARRGV